MFQDADLWDEREYKEGAIVSLNPKELLLAQTLETVHFASDLMGLVEARSSWARMGVGVHVTAPKIDPGWNKRITLELTNHSTAKYELEAGIEKPCQLILLQVPRSINVLTCCSVISNALCQRHFPPLPRLNQTRNGRLVLLQRARQISSSEAAGFSPPIRAPQCPQKFFRPPRSPPHFVHLLTANPRTGCGEAIHPWRRPRSAR